MARNLIAIDRDKLRAEVRKLGNERVFYMLDEAIELLSSAQLHKLAKKYLDDLGEKCGSPRDALRA